MRSTDESAAEAPALAPREAIVETSFFDAGPWPASFLLARRVGVLAAIAGTALIILSSHIPVCPMVNLFGRPCPGCGLTRATLACLHCDFGGAARLQPLVFFATPLVVICGILGAHSYLKIGKVRFTRPAARILMPPLKLLYAALIALWVVRFFGALGGPVPVDPSLFARIF